MVDQFELRNATQSAGKMFIDCICLSVGALVRMLVRSPKDMMCDVRRL